MKNTHLNARSSGYFSKWLGIHPIFVIKDVFVISSKNLLVLVLFFSIFVLSEIASESKPI